MPDVIENINVKVMSRTSETRYIEWHETCKCKCRLDVIVCNNKQRWNCQCKNWLTKECVIKDLFETQVIGNVNVINHVMSDNIYIMQIVSVEKG